MARHEVYQMLRKQIMNLKFFTFSWRVLGRKSVPVTQILLPAAWIAGQGTCVDWQQWPVFVVCSGNQGKNGGLSQQRWRERRNRRLVMPLSFQGGVPRRLLVTFSQLVN